MHLPVRGAIKQIKQIGEKTSRILSQSHDVNPYSGCGNDIMRTASESGRKTYVEHHKSLRFHRPFEQLKKMHRLGPG
jgi:hypothetical protein